MIQIQMTPEQFDATAAAIEAQTHQPLTTPNGTLKHSGVELSYAFDGSMLTAKVVDKPFFLTDDYVETLVRAWLTSQLAS
jgi:hypothetical protein